MNEQPDETLVKDCLRGIKTACGSLSTKYYKTVYAMCFSIMGRLQDAEDAAQEVSVKAITSLAKLKKPSLFKAWLMQITRNHCISFIRSKKNSPILTDKIEQFLPSVTDSDKHQSSSILINLKKLSQDHRSVLTLYYLEDQKVSQVAQTLDVSNVTVYRKLKEARIALYNLMKKEGHSNG